jgi:hypothetical protein
MIDRSQPGDGRPLRQGEGQAAGATTDFDHVLAVRDAGMIDK